MSLKTTLFNNKYALIFLVVVWAVFFSRTLIGHDVYFLDDLKIIFYPLEFEYARFQHAGNLPLWSNYFGFGHPLLAWGQLGFFTPLHVALRMLPLHTLTLLQVSIVAYFLIGLTGTYAFLRSIRCSQAAATLGACVFTFSGFNVGHLNHVNFYTGTMLLPLLLLAIEYFIHKPSLRSSIPLIGIATSIIVSAQPQIVAYTLTIASLWGIARTIPRRTAWKKIIALTVVSATVTCLLSSMAILPLLEFLPFSDRAETPPPEVQYEFSYPPSHALTLIFPYLFGDHDNYWGAKGFQELAAYTGIIPLMLIPVGIQSIRKKRDIVSIALFFVVFGTVMALGKHSYAYEYLVENHLMPGLNVPGRFVYFVITGGTILAALGLDKIRHSAINGALIAIGPFGLYALAHAVSLADPAISYALLENMQWKNPIWILAILGASTVIAAILAPQGKLRILQWGAAGIVALTLIVYGWDYNPLTPRHIAFATPAFSDELQQYHQQTGLPPRILSAEFPSETSQRQTEPISPLFTIHQPVQFPQDSRCLDIPIEIGPYAHEAISISLREHLLQDPIFAEDVDPLRIRGSSYMFCVPNDISLLPNPAFITFSSKHDSDVRLHIEEADSEARYVYFVRVENPTEEQIARSRKPFGISIGLVENERDKESLMLARHLNVTQAASNTHWIGALAIRPYREFIGTFFANDGSVLNGNQEHVLTSSRKFFDAAGTTHIIQHIPKHSRDTSAPTDTTTLQEIESDTGLYRILTNNTVLPKAYLVSDTQVISAADETRTAMLQDVFDPANQAIVNGPKPPEDVPQDQTEFTGEVKITHYSDTRVDIDVHTPRDAFLILTDAYTPQWQTYLDGDPAPKYFANSFMRAARVPEGSHTISFQYKSVATQQALLATHIGIAGYLGIIALGVIGRGSAARPKA